MTTKNDRIFSDLPIPPGEILEEELEARGMTQKELAARLNRPAQAISEIINAKKAITPDTAIGLEKVLGIDAHFWTNLEGNYRMTLARNRDNDMLTENVKWLEDYPIREMVKRNWIPAGRDRPSRLRALLGFLGLASAEPGAYQKAVGFRITEAAQRKVSPGALAAWLRKGELEAQTASTAEYDESAFREALSQIRQMTMQSPGDFIPAMTKLCAEAGVALCMVQELPKSGANGVTRWLTDRRAMIQMSIRYKWADIFWFTFLHQACHLLKHRTQGRIMIDGIGGDPELEELEAEADRFARDFLISPEEWSDFCGEDYFTADRVREFAQFVGIAPFIVVGRLQKEKRICYNQFASLNERYEWSNDHSD